MPLSNLPRHVAVIMDGNGRWAKSRGLPRFEGHRRGAQRAKEIIKAANDMGIGVLTLYAFSMENWQRPQKEISLLMKLLELYLKHELSTLISDGVVFKCIGDLWKLPDSTQALILDVEEKTSKNTGMTLVSALSYGGRDELLRAVAKALHTGLKPGEITEDLFSSLLDTQGIPDPDLIIRTSGEKRISNFLLWQSAYSELYFTDTLWPDFSPEEFMVALRDYESRERRFGAVSVKSPS